MTVTSEADKLAGSHGYVGYGGADGKEAVKQAHQGNSMMITAGIIIADVVGAGILSMAVAVSKLGWALGTVGIMVLLAMNVHISILMWRVHMSFPKAKTYCELVECAFSRATAQQRFWARKITIITQYLFLFSMLGLYVLSAGKGLGSLFYTQQVCLPTWCILSCLLLLPFHLPSRRLGHWKSLIYLNVATIVGTVSIPLITMFMTGVESTRPAGSIVVPVATLTLPNVVASLSTFTFAFTSQFMITEIVSEMEDRREFPTSYIYVAAPFQAVAFLAVGLIGYYYMGSAVSGMIGDNLPFGSAFRLAAFCLVSHMLITYLIKSIVLCNGIQETFEGAQANADSPGSWHLWTAIVLSVAVLAWTLSQIVPFFTDAVDLLGATLTPIACYMIPIILYFRWWRDFSTPDQVSTVELSIVLLEFLFAIAVMIFGTYYSVTEIQRKWETYGAPFECHCEGMWNTCDCSKDHVGMKGICSSFLELFDTMPWLGPM
eukprot:TRINITY_DN15454_c0_g2_i1.p1 TRINITY_DN15454_c0_g2~~TRINITY_DN15454_c0_g2_i1.p1  ORF type:complete len:489 (+),score=87.85 TRINITY_DN15454_c0_g2_i1:263-1729(+)